MSGSSDATPEPPHSEDGSADEKAVRWWQSGWVWVAGGGLVLLIGGGSWLLLSQGDGSVTTVVGTTTTTTGVSRTSSTSASTSTASTPPTTAVTPTPDDCSAAALPASPDAEDGLPIRVAEMRERIVAAAVACDFDQLRVLALAGRPDFTHTDLDPSITPPDPGDAWRQQEQQGGDPLARLVRLLDRPFETAADQYWQTSVYRWVDAPEDCGVYDDHLLCEQVIIADDGDWLTFYRPSP